MKRIIIMLLVISVITGCTQKVTTENQQSNSVVVNQSTKTTDNVVDEKDDIKLEEDSNTNDYMNVELLAEVLDNELKYMKEGNAESYAELWIPEYQNTAYERALAPYEDLPLSRKHYKEVLYMDGSNSSTGETKVKAKVLYMEESYYINKSMYLSMAVLVFNQVEMKWQIETVDHRLALYSTEKDDGTLIYDDEYLDYKNDNEDIEEGLRLPYQYVLWYMKEIDKREISQEDANRIGYKTNPFFNGGKVREEVLNKSKGINSNSTAHISNPVLDRIKVGETCPEDLLHFVEKGLADDKASREESPDSVIRPLEKTSHSIIASAEDVLNRSGEYIPTVVIISWGDVYDTYSFSEDVPVSTGIIKTILRYNPTSLEWYEDGTLSTAYGLGETGSMALDETKLRNLVVYLKSERIISEYAIWALVEIEHISMPDTVKKLITYKENRFLSTN